MSYHESLQCRLIHGWPVHLYHRLIAHSISRPIMLCQYTKQEALANICLQMFIQTVYFFPNFSKLDQLHWSIWKQTNSVVMEEEKDNQYTHKPPWLLPLP